MRAYRDILAVPGAAWFSFTGAFARLPLSMAGLGIVLLVESRSGSYGRAGAVAAAFVLVAAVSGPVQGRLADRLGQAPVLVVAGALHALGMGLLLAVVDTDLLPFVAAAIAGAGAPQAGNFVRARWAHALKEQPNGRLETAFALEAVLDEAVFVLGPVLVTFVTLQVLDIGGLLLAATLSTGASWFLAAQSRTAPPVTRTRDEVLEPLLLRLLVPIAIAAIGVGVLFGSTEVIVAAYTKEAGQPGLAGVILAIWAAGSLVAGLVVGVLPPGNALNRFRGTVLGMGVLFLPFTTLSSVAVLAVGMFVAGAMISPAMIALTRIVQAGTPPRRFTEGLAWVTTGISGGIALGAAAAGRLIDAEGASAGFFVPFVAGLAAFAVAWTLRPGYGGAR